MGTTGPRKTFLYSVLAARKTVYALRSPRAAHAFLHFSSRPNALQIGKPSNHEQQQNAESRYETLEVVRSWVMSMLVFPRKTIAAQIAARRFGFSRSARSLRDKVRVASVALPASTH